MNNLTVPSKLKKGDLIGIISPSAGIHPKAAHRIESVKKMIEKMGFRVCLGKSVMSEGVSYVSGSIEDRVADLHDMFKNPEVKMVLTATGGNHSNHLLSYIDYDMIRKNPKIFIGASDITVLHYALNTQAGLATYYGPCAASQFGEYPEMLPYTKKWFDWACVENESFLPSMDVEASEAWTDEFLDWFQKLDQVRPREMIKNHGYHWLVGGKSQGEALPACILSMNRLAGTKYWINPKGKILFFDVLISEGEINEALVDALLTDLKNIGVFDEIVGLVVGRPQGFTEKAKKVLYDQLQELTQKKYPIVTEFDIGHTDPLVTIRYGQKVELDSSTNQIRLLG